jgi:putative redox protein
MAGREVVVSSTTGPFEQLVSIGPHRLSADEPRGAGGDDAGPDPYELLMAAIGTCTSMTLAIYARRKGWPLQHVQVQLTHAREHAADCADCERGDRYIDRIQQRITLQGPLSPEQRSGLLAIVERCPVHRTLTASLDIRSELAETAPAPPP